MRKPAFCICENKDADQLRGYVISAFVFATGIVQSLFYLNPKFQASSHLLQLYSPVCVRPGRKPRRPVFSQRGLYIVFFPNLLQSLFNQSSQVLPQRYATFCYTSVIWVCTVCSDLFVREFTASIKDTDQIVQMYWLILINMDV